MLIKLFLALSGISPHIKKLLWRQWYQFLAGHHQTKDWSFMNYGYAPLHDHSDMVKLDEADGKCFTITGEFLRLQATLSTTKCLTSLLINLHQSLTPTLMRTADTT